eukprot:TRINITY_DN4877_c0_g1_i1.p1 TRINITY_DN4877_c0_g1~~TRINITY_DN4877_c0_g1_i1.p1  ORF type:complete len:132 (+),score=31.61 TRINITY_DN4877_c0_g1_i1:28-423(+)
MRKVFKEIFSRYIEEREEVNSGGGDEEAESKNGAKKTSTSYAKPSSSASTKKSSSGVKKNATGMGPNGQVSSALPSTAHGDVFSSPHTLGGQHHGLGHGGHHGAHHRGGRGMGGMHKPKVPKGRTTKRRKK